MSEGEIGTVDTKEKPEAVEERVKIEPVEDIVGYRFRKGSEYIDLTVEEAEKLRPSLPQSVKLEPVKELVGYKLTKGEQNIILTLKDVEEIQRKLARRAVKKKVPAKRKLPVKKKPKPVKAGKIGSEKILELLPVKPEEAKSSLEILKTVKQLSIRTVRGHLKKLADKGLVATVKAKDERGRPILKYYKKS